MYTRYVITQRAYEDVKDLDNRTKRWLKQELQERLVRNDPLMDAEKLPDKRQGTYRWRIGDFRVIFDVEKRKRVVILRFQHRRELYKK
jgi:mRNA interferase RelE/StbE